MRLTRYSDSLPHGHEPLVIDIAHDADKLLVAAWGQTLSHRHIPSLFPWVRILSGQGLPTTSLAWYPVMRSAALFQKVITRGVSVR
jgi:hypothetical protein